jgi:hypothetical protein
VLGHSKSYPDFSSGPPVLDTLEMKKLFVADDSIFLRRLSYLWGKIFVRDNHLFRVCQVEKELELRDRRNVFSYCLKRLVLFIMSGDFPNLGNFSSVRSFPRFRPQFSRLDVK